MTVPAVPDRYKALTAMVARDPFVTRRCQFNRIHSPDDCIAEATLKVLLKNREAARKFREIASNELQLNEREFLYAARDSASYSSKKERKRQEILEGGYAVTQSEKTVVDGDPLEKEEEREAVRRALSGLSEPQRISIHKLFFEGWSTKKISEWLNKPESTVKSHVRRGCIKLRSSLSNLTPEAP